ncbi:MAG: helix-turn-helix domain-containing protein [Rhodanobacter sp.]
MTQCSMTRRLIDGDAQCPGIDTSSFSTRALSADAQVLAWRKRVEHVIDVPPSKKQLTEGFGANIDFYAVNGMAFSDCRTDAMVIDRSVARVSTDSRRDYVFHLFLEGDIGNVAGMRKKRSAADSTPGIIAFDMSQPFHVDRPACRVLSLFVPRPIVDAGLPDGESIHGRVLPQGTPLAGLVLDHLAAIGREISKLDAGGATDALHAGAELLVAGFRKASCLTGADRAALQTAMMGQVRRFVEASLHQSDLTPTHVINALQLKRATIYRWFEHEGGLGAYIRRRRLLMAADELVRFPHLPVIDIAYGLGFKSASDFTRAFRRTFYMNPQDMRARALGLQQIQATKAISRHLPGAAVPVHRYLQEIGSVHKA